MIAMQAENVSKQNTRNFLRPVRSSHNPKPKALVMDDDATLLLLTLLMLESSGYEAHWARTGDEAIEKYRNARETGASFDVIILDLNNLDGKGGKETIKSLLQMDGNVKAVITSGDSSDPAMTDFKKYGFCGALRKPFSITELNRILTPLFED